MTWLIVSFLAGLALGGLFGCMLGASNRMLLVLQTQMSGNVTRCCHLPEGEYRILGRVEHHYAEHRGYLYLIQISSSDDHNMTGIIKGLWSEQRIVGDMFSKTPQGIEAGGQLLAVSLPT